MENISKEYLMRAETWLLLSTLAYFLMNGAQIFETAVVVPKWTASPPASFQLLADKNGASLKTFWIACHSLHEVTFLLAIAFCWKLDPIRNWLLLLFALHFAVRVWTLGYFAPNIIEFQKIAGRTVEPSKDLAQRVAAWQRLNYVRVTVFIAISFTMLPLLMKLKNLGQG